MSEHVLVTGGSGFVGNAVLDELVRRGHTATATCIEAPGTLPQRPGVAWLAWDATQPALPSVDWSKVTAVLHLAAPPNLFDFPGQAAAMYEITVGTTFRLLEAARAHGVKRFVLASTGDVLGSSDGLAREDDLLYLPGSFYGAAKACAELLLRSYAALIPTAILRFYHPYGPKGDRFLINRLLRMVGEGREVKIEGENGILLNPVWTEDLARGICLALESRETGVFHLAGPDTETLREMLLRMGRLTGREPVIRQMPGVVVERHAGSYERSTAVLGYRPQVGLDEGLRRLL